jgi:hypothetical protein
MNRKHLAGLASLVLVVALTGCGRKLHPVQGQVLWEDGQPARELAGRMIYFESLEQRSISRSTIKEDGSFQLTTDKPEARGTDGAPPGHHRVYLVDGTPPLLEKRFCRPDTSGLEVTVPSDGPVILKVARTRVKYKPVPASKLKEMKG